VLQFIGILFNGRTELNLARGMDVCPCRSGQAKDLWWTDSPICNILQHISVGFRKPWFQLDWTVEPKRIWEWQISTAKQFLWHRHLIKRRCFKTANRFLSCDSCIEIFLFCLSIWKHL